jgi:hypothetical protein
MKYSGEGGRTQGCQGRNEKGERARVEGLWGILGERGRGGLWILEGTGIGGGERKRALFFMGGAGGEVDRMVDEMIESGGVLRSGAAG